MEIIYAGYGVWNQVFEVTNHVIQLYNEGCRQFLADPRAWGDPHPGERKYLFIVWRRFDRGTESGLVGDWDTRGIILP